VWQVTLCDPIWHVSSCSGVVLVAQTAIPFFTFFIFTLYSKVFFLFNFFPVFVVDSVRRIKLVIHRRSLKTLLSHRIVRTSHIFRNKWARKLRIVQSNLMMHCQIYTWSLANSGVSDLFWAILFHEKNYLAIATMMSV